MAEPRFRTIGSSTLSPVDNKKRKEILVEKPRKTITKLFWTYGDNEKPVSSKSRFYVDLNLHAETENYVKGEVVKVTIESDDGKNIAEGSRTITLSLPVAANGKAKLHNIFEGKKIELFSQEQV